MPTRNPWLRLFAIVIIAATLAGTLGVSAQGNLTAPTISNLNVRSGPGEEYGVITTIPRGVAVNVEGRNRRGDWVLVNTGAGGARGWVASRYLIWPGDFEIGNLEVLGDDAANSSGGGLINTGAPVETPNAWPADRMNLRQGPDTAHPSLGLIEGGTPLVLEARTFDNVWALVHTADWSVRGWVALNFLSIALDVDMNALPVSGEIVDPNAPPPVAAAPAAPEAPITGEDETASPELPPVEGVPGNLSADAQAIVATLQELPVVSGVGQRVRDIFAYGQTLGNRAHVVAKVGDSNTERQEFLGSIAYGRYDLGSYGYLQPTIDFFTQPIAPGMTNSFARQSYAGTAGYTAWFISDPRWNNPACPSLSPLECEITSIRPSVAVILFGLADIRYMTPADFETAMRRIIEINTNAGVIPVLYTFTVREDARAGEWEMSLQFDRVLVNLASEYQVPLVNLWRLLYPMPAHGIDADQIHLSLGPDGIFFTGDEQTWGYTAWNLATLQMLDTIRTQAMG
ncbi:MAG: SH3 domain-containing protein [Anaerolineae bacterium]|nr:SH3 domain-containing protein [Anaerolineae bacterium]